MTRFSLASIFLFAAACGTPSDVVEEPTAEAFIPLEGMWIVDARGIEKDECGGILGSDDQDPEAEKDSFELVLQEDNVFTIWVRFDDGETYDIDCVRDGMDFTCEGYRDLYTISDTTLSLSWAGGGEFLSETEFTTSLDATALCDGSLCGVAEGYIGAELPCDGTMTMDAVFDAALDE